MSASSSSSSSRSESSYGGVRLSEEERNELMNEVGVHGAGAGGDETGDHGHNTTGWVRQPDGTMIKKSSSWASWSKTSSSHGGGGDHDELERVKGDLETKVRDHLNAVREDKDSLPPNVEPGFEQSYWGRSEEHSSTQSRQR